MIYQETMELVCEGEPGDSCWGGWWRVGSTDVSRQGASLAEGRVPCSPGTREDAERAVLSAGLTALDAILKGRR